MRTKAEIQQANKLYAPLKGIEVNTPIRVMGLTIYFHGLPKPKDGFHYGVYFYGKIGTTNAPMIFPMKGIEKVGNNSVIQAYLF